MSRPRHHLIGFPPRIPAPTFNATFFGWLIFIASISLLGILVLTPLLKLTFILCYVDGTPCSPALQAELNTHLGQPLWLINPAILTQSLLGVETIEAVEIKPVYPRTLLVQAATGQPLAYLENPDKTAYLGINSLGRVITQAPSLPPGNWLIVALDPQNWRPGDMIDQSILVAALNLVGSLKSGYLAPSSITVVSDTTLSLTLPDGKQALFTTTKPYSRQVSALQQILTKATIGQSVSIIDVRFEQPVLRP